MMERHAAGLEVRAEGRRLSGTVLRYGDVSPSHRERFEPGSLRMAETVHLDLHHDPEKVFAWEPGGGLKLADSREALSMTAHLPKIPAAERALNEVRAGKTTGLSVEFRAERERRDNGIRVIERATLAGIGLVRSPSYQQSTVEARRRSFLRASIPASIPLPCDCVGRGCKYAEFTAAAMSEISREMNEMFDRAYEGATETARAADILLIAGRGMENAVASARRGTLKAHVLEDGALHLEAFAEDTPRAIAEMAGVPLFVRPIISEEDSQFADADGVRKYDRAAVRAFLAKPIAGDSGDWPEAIIEPPETRERLKADGWRVWL